MSWSSRSFISRIFCIFTFFRDYSLHLLALKSHSCLRILLSLQSSHEVVACSPTALVSLGLEVSYMFSLFLIANPKCPFFHNVKRLYHPQLFCMQAFPSHPSCFEDFSSWITLSNTPTSLLGISISTLLAIPVPGLQIL